MLVNWHNGPYGSIPQPMKHGTVAGKRGARRLRSRTSGICGDGTRLPSVTRRLSTILATGYTVALLPASCIYHKAQTGSRLIRFSPIG